MSLVYKITIQTRQATKSTGRYMGGLIALGLGLAPCLQRCVHKWAHPWPWNREADHLKYEALVISNVSELSVHGSDYFVYIHRFPVSIPATRGSTPITHVAYLRGHQTRQPRNVVGDACTIGTCRQSKYGHIMTFPRLGFW